MIVIVLPDVALDDTLLARARKGDQVAVAHIYERYFEPIYQFCRLRVGSPQLAEDISANVFLALLQGIQAGKGPKQSLRGWLFRVARNKIIDHYGTDPGLPLETIEQWFPDDDSKNPELAVIEALQADRIRALIQKLSADQQEVLLLRFDQQLSLREVADIMDKNINTIKTLQVRAIQKLRNYIEPQQAEGQTA